MEGIEERVRKAGYELYQPQQMNIKDRRDVCLNND